jgi:putative intracellular protease/amidase
VATVLVPIPDRDFDPTEVAVSWRVLTGSGHRVIFATESGTPGVADEIMVTGRGLDVWSALPLLSAIPLVGLTLRANKDGRNAYRDMVHSARGMRSYIDSGILHRLVVEAFARGLVVGAICHGVLLAARSVDPETGRSVLYGRKTTALTWAMEGSAWRLTRFTRFWDRNYYRTYTEEPGQPDGYMSVQSEVTRALEDPADFRDVARGSPHRWRKSSGMVRDTPADSRPAFVVDDGGYVSARWPGDTHTFASLLSQKLKAAG